MGYLWAEHGGTLCRGDAAIIAEKTGPYVRQGEGREVRRFTLLNVECARLTPAPIMRNDNGRKLVIRNLRLAAIIT